MNTIFNLTTVLPLALLGVIGCDTGKDTGTGSGDGGSVVIGGCAAEGTEAEAPQAECDATLYCDSVPQDDPTCTWFVVPDGWSGSTADFCGGQAPLKGQRTPDLTEGLEEFACSVTDLESTYIYALVNGCDGLDGGEFVEWNALCCACSEESAR